MSAEVTGHAEQQLTLRADLDELGQVQPWIERLATKHAIPERVQFSINVCLEEALSNVIRHGYRSQSDKTVTVRFSTPTEGSLLFLIDDEAPTFNPLSQPELSPLNPLEEMRVGGQGIRMLREFADTLEYEQTPTGNILKIGFLSHP